MKHSLKQTLLGSGALASLLLSASLVSCQDEDYGFSSAEVRAAAYDRNFIAKYGEIDPEQNWDLSKYADNGNRAQTRAAIPACPLGDETGTGWGTSGSVETVNEWFFVEQQLVNAFNQRLPEGQATNRNEGTTDFSLFSNGVFYIIPMYQGQSGVASHLHMQVTYGGNTYDHMIWTRSEGIERQSKGSFDWKELRNNHQYFKNIDYYCDTNPSEGEPQYLASTRDAKGIKSKPIKCDIPYGAEIKFYLHINNGHLNYGADPGYKDFDSVVPDASKPEANLAMTGDKMWSDQGQMIQLYSTNFTANNLDRYGKEFMFIACEDAWAPGSRDGVEYDSPRNVRNYDVENGGGKYTKNSNNTAHVKLTSNDWMGDDDMNDLVFLFVSDNLPSVIEANQTRKRYIIEDLGSIVDWDFNDVVVDLVETTNPTTSQKSQKAVLKHLCGTTPFRLFIGDQPGNTSTSTELKFSCSNLPVKMDDGSYENLTISNASGSWIPGLQMSQYEELNLECNLPPSNPWKSDQNNIWVLVVQNRQYAPNRNNNGYNDDSQTGADPYGGTVSPEYNEDVIKGEINDMDPNFATVAFPRKGKVPRIIAVDTDFQWTKEDNDISKDLWSFYTISSSTYSADGTGRGSVSGAGSYKGGRTVTLTATPEPGNIFVKWSNGSTERTLTFTANENVSYTAEFKNVTDPKGYPINISTQFGQATLNIEQLLKDGYNTIKVYAANNANGSFGLKSNGSSTLDYIVAGDASDYKIVNGVGTVVLTEDQIKKIEDDSKTITVVSRSTDITLNNVSLLNTQDYFTVELMPIEGQHGEITTADNDRFSGDWDAGNTPYKNNGRRPFVKASYAAPTDNNPEAPGCVLTAVPDDGYKFVKWEQYDGNTLLNTDTRNPITVKSDAKLKAIFAEKQNYTVSVYANPTAGGTVQIGNGDWGSNVSDEILEGTTITLRAKANTNYEFVKWTSGHTTTEREVTVTKAMNPGAKFGKILLNSNQNIQYQSGDGWQNYTFNLYDYKSELSQNSNTFIITMDTRVKQVRFMINGWDTELSRVNVDNGKCVVTFSNSDISSINSASHFFMHVLDPETTEQNLQNAKVTKIVCYQE